MKVYIDGSGNGKYGFFVEETNTAKVFIKENITNNQAEYLAVLEALKRPWPVRMNKSQSAFPGSGP